MCIQIWLHSCTSVTRWDEAIVGVGLKALGLMTLTHILLPSWCNEGTAALMKHQILMRAQLSPHDMHIAMNSVLRNTYSFHTIYIYIYINIYIYIFFFAFAAAKLGPHRLLPVGYLA